MEKGMRRDPTAIGVAIRELQAKYDVSYNEHSKLIYLMHELSRLVSTYFDRTLAAHRLTHAQWWGLMHIFRREGVTQTELAAILQMGRASTGKLLERLEAKHWIERRIDPTDSRVRRVYLREEAVPVFALMAQAGKDLYRALLKDVTRAEEARLIAVLKQIRSNAEAE